MNKKLDINTIKRILKYITANYKGLFIIVLITIFINTIANTAGSLYLEVLVDDYIVPLIGVENPVYTEFIKAIGVMVIIYAIAIITIFICTRVMVKITEGVLKKIRDDMFIKMQRLPIKYFDTHTHGDIMSRYTNDTDTLSELISQSMPQVFTSLLTIVIVFIAMIIANIYLTAVVIISLIIMLFITKKIAGGSAKYFIKQQESIGKVNGYIEEMINGQKVVKVFCHEEKAKKDFDKINQELFEQNYKANKYANILMPTLVALRKFTICFNCNSRRNISIKWNRKHNNRINSIFLTT